MKVILNSGQEIPMEDFINDNYETWEAIRFNGVSASMADSPYTDTLLLKYFDKASKRMVRHD